MNKLFKKETISQETIDFQLNDKFVSDLTAIYSDMKNELEGYISSMDSFFSLDKDKPYKEAITNLIYDRFGIPTQLVWSIDSPLSSIIAPRLMENHILKDIPFSQYPAFIKKKIKDLEKDVRSFKVSVDIKHVVVNGIAKSNKTMLYMNYHHLFSIFKLTPEEVAGVTIHEIGHAFTYIENLDRIVKVNSVLTDVINASVDGKKDKKFDFKIREAIPSDKQKDQYVNLKDSPSKVIWSINTYRCFIESFKELKEGNKYNQTTSEQLADQFASRFGLGKALISGLDKMYKVTPEMNDSLIMVASVLASMYIGLFLSFLSGTFFLIPFMFIGSILGSLPAFSFTKWDFTYDQNLDRFVRIKQQYIALLADDSIPKKIKIGYLKDIDLMEKIIKRTKPKYGWITKLVNTFGNGNKIKRIMDLERTLEELSYNDLYVKYLQLTNYKED